MSARNGYAIDDQERPIAEDLRRSRDEARALGGEAREIASDLRELLQKETELAIAELRETAGKATKGLIWGAIAAVMGLAFVMFAFLTLLFALDEVMSTVAAAAITTGVIAALLAITGLIAMQLFKSTTIRPERTMRSIEEDIRWAKTRIRSIPR